jgi:hypothetical protein
MSALFLLLTKRVVKPWIKRTDDLADKAGNASLHEIELQWTFFAEFSTAVQDS